MNKVDIISEVLSQFYDANLRDAATRDWIASQIDKKIENYDSEIEFSNGKEDVRAYKPENLGVFERHLRGELIDDEPVNTVMDIKEKVVEKNKSEKSLPNKEVKRTKRAPKTPRTPRKAPKKMNQPKKKLFGQKNKVNNAAKP